MSDTYRKAKKKKPGRLILLLSGRMAYFIREDAYEVSYLLGEPISSEDFGCPAVRFDQKRIPEIKSRLSDLNREIFALKRNEAPPRKWIPISLESKPDISNIAFPNQIAAEDLIEEFKAGRINSAHVTSWIWYVFPRLSGSWDTSSDNSHGLKSLRESRVFMKRKQLSDKTRLMAEALLSNPQKEIILSLLGSQGMTHLQASATLFSIPAKEESVKSLFNSILHQFFDGKTDDETVKAIESELNDPRDDTPRDLLFFRDSSR